jgi:heme/copper-type cytochrome/quinol oxidase subunit 2
MTLDDTKTVSLSKSHNWSYSESTEAQNMSDELVILTSDFSVIVVLGIVTGLVVFFLRRRSETVHSPLSNYEDHEVETTISGTTFLEDVEIAMTRVEWVTEIGDLETNDILRNDTCVASVE